jgi:hypothetical protein
MMLLFIKAKGERLQNRSSYQEQQILALPLPASGPDAQLVFWSSWTGDPTCFEKQASGTRQNRTH